MVCHLLRAGLPVSLSACYCRRGYADSTCDSQMSPNLTSESKGAKLDLQGSKDHNTAHQLCSALLWIRASCLMPWCNRMAASAISANQQQVSATSLPLTTCACECVLLLLLPVFCFPAHEAHLLLVQPLQADALQKICSAFDKLCDKSSVL